MKTTEIVASARQQSHQVVKLASSSLDTVLNATLAAVTMNPGLLDANPGLHPAIATSMGACQLSNSICTGSPQHAAALDQPGDSAASNVL